MRRISSLILFISIVILAVLAPKAHAETLHVYGPGGPAPAMKEAAEVFGKKHSIDVEVTAGPTDSWLDKAKADADVIYSGAEYMMTDFVRALSGATEGGAIDESSIRVLYLRPAAILVRPGNPRHIRGFADLLRPNTKILVVNGAGQAGLWEDVAGRQGNIATVRAFRKNIVAFAPNSADAKKTWTERPEIDAWLIWNIWQVANPSLADVVPLEKTYAIYRDSGVALTQRGKNSVLAVQFVEFLQSSEGAKIFAKWGWMTNTGKP